MQTTTIRGILVVAAFCVGAAAAAAQSAAAAGEDALIAVLKSEAGLKEKADACRELGRVGTGKAVPALAALLDHEKLSHMARYALEPIPDPAVDRALREALGNVKGKPLVGVITSLGVRRDAEAAAPLAALMGNADPDVADAAARALGQVGTTAAAQSLRDALAKASGRQQLAVTEGLLRCAEALAQTDASRAKALEIYDRLRGLGTKSARQVRTAALRGAVLLRGNAGVPLLVEALRSRDALLVEAAARTSLEMPGTAVTKALAGEVEALSAAGQVLLVHVLAKRGDPAALPALGKLARDGNRTVRVAVAAGLAEIGGPGVVPILAVMTRDTTDDVAGAARNALGAMAGDHVDAALVSMLEGEDAEARATAVELVARRGAAAAAPALMRAAGRGDEAGRIASIKALGALAGPKEFGALVGMLAQAPSAAQRQAIEAAVSQVCARHARVVAGEVTVDKAVYGVLPDGASADVTAKVAGLVKGGATEIQATNATFGDPTPGLSKKLRVDYTVRGKAMSATVNEGQTLRLAAGAPPQAFINALRGARANAAPESREALDRILQTYGGAGK